jgi:YbbR domain-containing protein
MKKIISFFGKVISRIVFVFDKFLVTPITRLILKIMEASRNFAKSIDRLASKKSTLLVVSLLLAFGVFVLIDNESNVMIDQYAEILYDQTVTAVYNEESYVVEGLPKAVDITLIGQRRHIFLAKQSPSKGVTVDLTGLKPGTHKVVLKYNQRLKSLDYKLDPSTVNVTIYEKESENRTLTYDVLHKDALDSKLYINNVEIDRSEVIIKGAKYKLQKVASVRALLDVNNIPNPKAGDITVKDIPLVAYDTDGKILDVEIVPKTVAANVSISSPSKEVPIRVVPVGNLAFGKSIKSITPSISTITVYGDQSAVDELQQLDVEIDVKGLDKDKEYNVTLKKPKGITELSSKSIKISVIIDNANTKEFKDISISTKNLADGLVAQASSDSDRKVTVVVSGSQDAIDNIKESDITAYVDLKDYGVGTHEVEVVVTGTDLKLAYSSKVKKVKIVISKKN